MVVITESGSQYIVLDGLCRKFDTDGTVVDMFKVWTMKAVDSWEDLTECNSEVQVGKRMCIGGPDSQWITTPVKKLIP